MSPEATHIADKPFKARLKRKLLRAEWLVRHWARKVLGWVLIALGFVLIAAGFALMIVPGHYVLVIIGLILVLRNAFWARRQFIRLKKKHPNWVMPMRKLLRRNPPVASVFWHSLLKTERFVLRKGRTLPVWRRRYFRKPKSV